MSIESKWATISEFYHSLFTHVRLFIFGHFYVLKIRFRQFLIYGFMVKPENLILKALYKDSNEKVKNMYNIK